MNPSLSPIREIQSLSLEIPSPTASSPAHSPQRGFFPPYSPLVWGSSGISPLGAHSFATLGSFGAPLSPEALRIQSLFQQIQSPLLSPTQLALNSSWLSSTLTSFSLFSHSFHQLTTVLEKNIATFNKYNLKAIELSHLNTLLEMHEGRSRVSAIFQNLVAKKDQPYSDILTGCKEFLDARSLMPLLIQMLHVTVFKEALPHMFSSLNIEREIEREHFERSKLRLHGFSEASEVFKKALKDAIDANNWLAISNLWQNFSSDELAQDLTILCIHSNKTVILKALFELPFFAVFLERRKCHDVAQFQLKLGSCLLNIDKAATKDILDMIKTDSMIQPILLSGLSESLLTLL